MMRKIFVAALAALLLAGPAAAQMGAIGLEPFIGYGFFGQLPDDGPTIEEAVAYGGRVFYQLSPQFAAFGTYQRAQPDVVGLVTTEATVDHWSGGVEFSYVPRGGAEGMLPIILEAGLGQARYEFDELFADANRSDLAVNLGIASALRFSPNFSIRYGANDYISNYDNRGILNQIFVRVGAELRF
jgi:hypothetical protein